MARAAAYAAWQAARAAAAKVIQGGWRRYRARNLRKELKLAAAKVAAHERERAAAVLIQARWRGKAARIELGRRREAAAAAAALAAAEEAAQRELEARQAAVRIQGAWRLYWAKKLRKRLRSAADAARAQSHREEAAAPRIQSMARRRAAIRRLRHAQAAATTIQARARSTGAPTIRSHSCTHRAGAELVASSPGHRAAPTSCGGGHEDRGRGARPCRAEALSACHRRGDHHSSPRSRLARAPETLRVERPRGAGAEQLATVQSDPRATPRACGRHTHRGRVPSPRGASSVPTRTARGHHRPNLRTTRIRLPPTAQCVWSGHCDRGACSRDVWPTGSSPAPSPRGRVGSRRTLHLRDPALCSRAARAPAGTADAP